MEPLALYGAGDEPAALRSLADALPTTETRLFAKHPVDELFLVAALWVASESRK
jgi:hypothetical protein